MLDTTLDGLELLLSELVGKLWCVSEIIEHLLWHCCKHVFDNLAVFFVHLMNEVNDVVEILARKESFPLGYGKVSPVIKSQFVKEVIHVNINLV